MEVFYRPYYLHLFHSLAADYEQLAINIDLSKCFQSMIDSWVHTHPDDCKTEYQQAINQLDELRAILEKGKNIHCDKLL